MNYSLDPEEAARHYAYRRSHGKLAQHRSSRRIVRKLPQTVMVVPVVEPPGILERVRTALNRHKALTYSVLLAAVVDAYIYAGDPSQWQSLVGTMQSTVQDARLFYFGT